MQVEAVTREILRTMKPGDTEIFTVSAVGKLESARACATQLKMYGLDFKTVMKPKELSIIITRLK